MPFTRIIRRAVLASALSLAPVAALADAHSQIVNAAMHAELASGAGALAGVQTHLHHTLNCLVGPKGAGFDAAQMNPCANAGSGAIPDAADAATRQKLETAAASARKGIAASELAAAKSAASETAGILNALK